MRYFVFLLSTICVHLIQSEVENNFTKSLKEVQTNVTELIGLDKRELFDIEYISAINYFQTFNFEEFIKDFQIGKHDNLTCHRCNQAVIYGKSVLINAEIIKVWANTFCTKQTFYKTKRVCYGTIERMAEHIVYILQNTKLTSAEVCSVLLHPNCMTHLNEPMSKNVIWELPLPEKKEFKPVIANLKPLKMLHLSDFHLDLWYTAGSNAHCNEPVCCRSTSFPPLNGNNRSAGHWSETDAFCDTPSVFIETSLRQIAAKHKDIDLIIWTGDSVAHDMWNTSQQINLKHLKTVSDQMKSSFKHIAVFPSLGNHDTHPNNFYVPSDVPKETNLTMSWLYDTLSDDYWSQWINTDSAKNTFKKGGYFSALVNKGLKIIVLNNGISDKRSYWIAHTPIDPDQQLKWLIGELNESETNGKYVIIIGHYPPSDCYVSWANNYFRIVERYRKVIAATYFGHTHQDEIVVFHNKNLTSNETYPVSVGLIAPSMTTFPFYNPGYRGRPLDFSLFYTDILSDNEKGPKIEPGWKFAFSAKDNYGITDMSPESWDQFITRAQTDDNLTERYYNHYHRFSQVFVRMNKDTIDKKKHIILKRRVINPIYDLL